MSVSPPSRVLPRILLVEDDLRLAALVQEFLSQHALNVTVETRGDRAAERIVAEVPDLVILDLMLPGMDGMEVCRVVRTHFRGPIIMLTARDEDLDQILGLEIGADDYIVKPVEPRVLLARIRALLRRQQPADPVANANVALVFGQLTINPASRRVTLGSENIPLSTSEFDLLWLLAANAGQTLSRSFILNSLRNLDYDGLARSIDIGISRLRKKLSDDADPPEKIKTVRSKGYLFVADVW